MADLPEGSLLATLIDKPMRPGKLVWIGLRPDRGAPLITPGTASLIAEHGIKGDRYDTKRNGARQATLMSVEDLSAIASFLGRDDVPPELLRRNFLVQGINLSALKGRRFRLGAALLEYSGDCVPCSQMEANLGPGGYNAVRGRGGITARILDGGEVSIGDALTRAD